jgi:hypothetical protein
MVIGPKLSILSLPAPGIGVEAKIRNVVGLSLDYQLIPDVRADDLKVEYTDVKLAAKWYPWHGAFSLGAAFGRRSFEATAHDDATNLDASVEVASTYLAPQLGWRWVWNSGLFLGMDLGYQIILSSRTTLSVPVAIAGGETDQDVKEAGDDLGKLGFPIVSLLQIGWFF